MTSWFNYWGHMCLIFELLGDDYQDDGDDYQDDCDDYQDDGDDYQDDTGGDYLDDDDDSLMYSFIRSVRL